MIVNHIRRNRKAFRYAQITILMNIDVWKSMKKYWARGREKYGVRLFRFSKQVVMEADGWGRGRENFGWKVMLCVKAVFWDWYAMHSHGIFFFLLLQQFHTLKINHRTQLHFQKYFFFLKFINIPFYKIYFLIIFSYKNNKSIKTLVYLLIILLSFCSCCLVLILQVNNFIIVWLIYR